MAEDNGSEDGVLNGFTLTMDPWRVFRLYVGEEDSGFKS